MSAAIEYLNSAEADRAIIEAALNQYHKPSYMTNSKVITIPLVDRNNVSAENKRLTSTLAIIICICELLERFYTSTNQRRKITTLKRIVEPISYQIGRYLTDQDVMMIGSKIDTMITEIGFDEQPSYLVYLSFAIAILTDSFPELSRTYLAKHQSDLDDIHNRLSDLHIYLSKKEKTEAKAHDARATDLYKHWAGLF